MRRWKKAKEIIENFELHMVIRDGQTYLTLKEIAPSTLYSADYLRIRILQKKLHGIKIGREWYTTKEWIKEYIDRFAYPEKRPQSFVGPDFSANELPRDPEISESPRFSYQRSMSIAPASSALRPLGKNDIQDQYAFQVFRKNLTRQFSANLIAVPAIAAAITMVLFSASASPAGFQKFTEKSVVYVSSLLTDPFSDRPEFVHTTERALKEGRVLLEETIAFVDDALITSPASFLDSVRSFAEAIHVPTRLLTWLGLDAPVSTPIAKVSPVSPIPLLGSRPLPIARTPFSGVPPTQVSPLRVREIIETTEVIRPADISLLRDELAQGSLSLRNQVNKLVMDVANLYDGPQAKTSVIQSFAPSQSINRLSDITLTGLTLADDVEIRGNLRLVGGCSGCPSGGTVNTGALNSLAYYSGGTTLDAASTVAFNPTSGYLGIGTSSPYAMLSVAQTIVANNIIATSTAINSGIGTSSPVSLFSVGGSGYFTGGLGVGTATTSAGGLQIAGQAVIGSNLEIRGGATSTFASGLSISSGCYSVNGNCVGGSGLVGSAAAGQATFWSSAGSLSGDSSFFWDNTSKRLGIATGTPGTSFAVTGAGVFTGHVVATQFVATSTEAISTFPVASTTSFSVGNIITVSGLGTSTFSGGVSSAGIRSTSGFESTAGDLLLTGGKIVSTGGGTSTFSGGLSAAGLASSNGLRVNAGDTILQGGFSVTGSSILPIASSTSFSIVNLIQVNGLGTSTFAGNLDVTGLGKFGSLQVTGSTQFTGDANFTGSATTTFGGGIQAVGLDSSRGLRVSTGDTILQGGLQVVGATNLNGASSTSFSIGDRLVVNGAGTSTFAGGISSSLLSASGLVLSGRITNTDTGTSTFSGAIQTVGLASSNGLSLTGGDFISSGRFINSNTGTSTFAGGATFAGLSTTNGLAITSGILDASGVGVLAGSLNVSGQTALGFASSTSLSLLNLLNVNGLGTSTFSGGLTFGHGSITNGLTVGNLLAVSGSGTSTFTGGIATGGLSSTNGFISSAGNLLLTGGIINATGGGTSTFTGGISAAGLASSGGLRVSAGDTILVGGLNVTGSSVLPIASTTSFSIANLLTVAGAGTSTFTGGLATGGLSSTNGFTSSAGNLILTGGVVNVTGGGTSTFSGGLSSAGLNSSSGLIVTGDTSLSGKLNVTNLATIPTASSTSLSIADRLTVAGLGTSTFSGSISALGLNVTNSATIGNLLTVSGTGTSTFTGGLSSAGLSSSAGITSSAGDLILTGGKIVSTGAGTSTFSGGISATGITTTNGLSVTSGTLNASGIGVLAGTLGVGTSSPAQTLGIGGNIIAGTGSGSVLTWNAGTVYLPIAATSTIPNIANSYAIATSSSAYPIIAINGSTGGLSLGAASSSAQLPPFTIDGATNFVGVATITPRAAFAVNGVILFGQVGATSTNIGNEIVNGNLSVKGTGEFLGGIHTPELSITGSGTTTFAGGVSAVGLDSSRGLRVSAGDTILAGGLNVTGSSILPIASSTSFSVSNLIQVNGAGTSTFTGGISSTNSGFSSANGFTSSAGNLLLTGGIINATGGGTSTFSGGLSLAGIRSTSGIESTAGDLILTGGKIVSTGGGTSTFSGGLSSSGLVSLNGLRVSAGDTVLAGGLNVTGSSILSIASSTSFSISNLLNVNGLGTSTFAGGLTTNAIAVGTSTPSPLYGSTINHTLLFGTSGATSTNVGNELINGALSVKGPAEFLGGFHAPEISITGSGTTTFAGGIQAVGIDSSRGLRVSTGDTILAGGLAITGQLNNTLAGTSTFSGGLSVGSSSGGLSVANGLAVTSGTLNASGIGVLAGTLGVGTSSPGAVLSVKGPLLVNSTSTIEGAGLIAQALAGTSTLSFYTAGAAAPRMVIDGSGNVGIGTAGPGQRLVVVSATNNSFDGFQVFANNLSQNVSHGWAGVSATAAYDITTGSGQPVTFSPAGTERIRITSSGLLGIGTTTPGTLLSVHNGAVDIGGPLTVENNIVTGYLTATSSTASFFNYASSTSLSLSNLLNVNGAGTSTFSGGLTVATSAGNVGIGTSSPWKTLGVGGDLGVNGKGIFYGNVGIGTANPVNALHVVGAAQVGTYAGSDLAAGGLSLASHQVFIGSEASRAERAIIFSSSGGTRRGTISSEWLTTNLRVELGDGSNVRLGIDANGLVGIGTTTPGTKLSVHNGAADIGGPLTVENNIVTGYLTATSSSASFFNYASSTSLSLSNLLNVNGAGTSTFSGGLTLATSAGTFGVGTSSPNSFALGVNGPIIFGNSGTSTDIGNLHVWGSLQVGKNSLIFNQNEINASGALGLTAAGSNAITLGTNGSERMRIDSAGNVGIGTTSPFATLSVHAAAGATSFAIGSSTATNFTVDAKGNVGVGTAGPLGKLHVSSGNTGFSVWSAVDDLVVESSADAGITILAPATKAGRLVFSHGSGQVQGEIKYDDATNEFSIKNGNTSGFLTFITNGVERMRIPASGNVGIGTTTPGAMLSVHGPALINGTTTAMGGLITPSISATGTLGFYTNGGAAPRMVIDASGNVGVGTTTPSAALGVGGSALIGTGSSNQLSLNVGTIYLPISSTTTIPGAVNAWSISTTTTNTILSIDGLNRRVGVGTERPQYRLVSNAGGSSATGVNTPLRISGGLMTVVDDATEFLMVQRDKANDYGAALRLVTTQSTPGFLNPRLDFLVQQTSTNALSSMGTMMTISGGGNVGIGLTAPGKLLHLYKSDGTVPELKIDNTSTTHSQGVSNTGYVRFSGLVAPGGNNNVEDKFLMGLRSGSANTAWDFIINDTVAAADRLVINQSGNVGIGDASPTEATLVVGSAGAGNIYGTFATANTETLCWDASGASLITDCTSLAKFKENVSELSLPGLETVMKLAPREFDWIGKEDGIRHDLGFIAEEVNAVSPLLASYSIRENGLELNGVKYERMSALFVKAIQEQQLGINGLSGANFSTSIPDQLAAGDIVSIVNGAVVLATSSDSFIGVAGDAPQSGSATTSVIMSGAVLTRVSFEGGPIQPGDRIALSSIPGVGVKATSTQATVGIALESLNGEVVQSQGSTLFVNEGKIKIFLRTADPIVSPTLHAIADGTASGSWSIDPSTGRVKIGGVAGLDMDGKDIMNVASIIGSNWSIDTSGVLTVKKVKTEELEVGSETHPSGITLYDKATGQPSCVVLDNGALAVSQGKCEDQGTSQGSGSVTPPPAPDETPPAPEPTPPPPPDTAPPPPPPENPLPSTSSGQAPPPEETPPPPPPEVTPPPPPDEASPPSELIPPAPEPTSPPPPPDEASAGGS